MTDPVAEEGGEQGEEGEEESRPGGDVGDQQVVDVDPPRRGQHQVRQEEHGQDQEGDQWLEPSHGRLETEEAAGDDLDVAEEGGHANQDDQDEVEACPEPAVAEGGEGLLKERGSREPYPGVNVVGHQGAREAVVRWVAAQLGKADQGEGEHRGEENPDQVRHRHDRRVPHQVRREPAVAGEGGEGAKTKLEREHCLSSCFKPGGRAGKRLPVRGEQVQDCVGSTWCQARPDGEAHQQHESGWHSHHARLAHRLGAGDDADEGGDGGDAEHQEQLMVEVTKLLQVGGGLGKDVLGEEALRDRLIGEEVEETSTRPHEDSEVEHGSEDRHQGDGEAQAGQQGEQVAEENTGWEA